jgi:ABC-type Fe3+/spermidine/putrescine transport system ATPase subunit
MTHVSIQHLTKVYPGASSPSVDDLTIEIQSGELTALLGPSGCGKTTTMKMLAGLLTPTSGEITFDGRSILGVKPEDRGVVMVFQNYLLFPYMSIEDNIGFGLKMRRMPKDEIRRRVGEMLDLVRLPDLGKRRPRELSGGQQQRVALARALIVRPNVLLLDEPLSNLDAHLRFEMRDLIRSLQRELGITTVFVTHDQEEAVVLADRIALILAGRLTQLDAPDAFYAQPVNEAAARFFGGHNFIPGVSEGRTFTSELGRFELPAGRRQGRGVLTFRPENVQIGASGACNSFAATVLSKIYLGVQTRLRLQAGGHVIEMLANPAAAANVEEGGSIVASVPPDALWILPESTTPKRGAA